MTQKPVALTDIYNLFPPKALTAEQKDLYQKTAAARGGESYEFHDSLYNRIKISREKSHILVVGHGGCGKSTELRMLASKLRDDDIPSITIEAREDLDLYNFSYIDIFMLIAEGLTKFATGMNLEVDERIIAAFREALSTKITQKYLEKKTETGVESSASLSATLPFLFHFISKIAADLKVTSQQREELRRQIDPKMNEIIKTLNELISEVNSRCPNRMVIIIDGLEKCRTEIAKKLFSEDISSLANINTHLVIACPINIFRSPAASILKGYFVAPTMPMIKTHHVDSVDKPYEKGVEVIKDLILIRLDWDSSFFEKGVLEEIIKMAGGSLRDTCRLVSDSAFEAYMRQKTTVDMDAAELSMNRLAKDLFFSAENAYFPMMKKIYNGYRTPSNDADLSALLYVGVVFEYNGEGWVDLHPLIRRYLDKRPEMLKEVSD